MRFLLIIAALSLASCGAGVTPPPAIQIERVEIPTPVPCVKRADIPAEPADIELSGHARADALALGAQAKDLRAWGRLSAAILLACSK